MNKQSRCIKPSKKEATVKLFTKKGKLENGIYITQNQIKNHSPKTSFGVSTSECLLGLAAGARRVKTILTGSSTVHTDAILFLVLLGTVI